MSENLKRIAKALKGKEIRERQAQTKNRDPLIYQLGEILGGYGEPSNDS